MADGQYSFSIRLDDEHLEQDVRRAASQYEKLVAAAKKAGIQIDESLKNPFENFLPPKNLPQQTTAVVQSFNGLNMATQQLVRELPAATMGLNTLFLAISNNLPIFADQIKQVSAANEQLRAQGKPTVSVIKQIIGSLFSWQTALVLGVTALTMYGKQIGNWIAGLFKGKKALDAVAEAERTLHDVRTQGVVDAQEEVVKINLAVKAMQDSTKSLDERKRAMMMLQEEYPEYLGNLTEEQMLNGDVADSVADLVKNIIALKEARQALNKIVENEENMRLLERTQGYAKWVAANDAYNATGRKESKRVESIGLGGGVYTAKTSEYLIFSAAQEQLLDNLEAMGKEGEKLVEIINDKYNGNVDAYIKAVTASNEKLKESASALVTDDSKNDSAAQREAEARARRIASLTKQLAADAEREATQAKIDAMAEGINKELAQIDHDYDLREQKIREREEQLKEARGGYLTESDMAGFNALREASRAERDRARASAYSFLDSTEEDIFGDTDKAMAEATERLREEQSKRSKAWEDYIIAYGTFQERLLGTAHKYNRLIAEAETEGERKTLEAERDAILAEYEVQASDWAKELVDKTTEQLNTMIGELQAQVDAKQAAFDALDSSDSTSAQAYREEINRLNAQIKVLQQQLGKAKKEVKDDNWADATQVFQNISQAANDAAEGLAEFDEGAANILRTMGQLAGTAINLIGAIQAVITASAAAAGTISAMEKTSVILAVIGATISVLISLFKGSDEVEQTMRQFKELNAELERFRKLAQIDSVEGTIFGEDAFGNFSNNLRVMRDASEELKATQRSFGNIYESQMAYFEMLLALYQAIGDTVGEKVIQGKIDELKAQGKSYQAVLGSFIVGGSGGKTLADLYPELFAGGEVSLEGLRKLKESDLWGKISQENRDLIDELIADWERYDKATKAVTDYLKDIFGELGLEINDAIVDAFSNGTDAAVAFGDVAGKVLENLISQIGYTAYIAPILSKAMEDVANLNKNGDLSAEDYLNALMGIVGDTMKAAEDAVDGYNEFLERSDRMAEEQGINTFNGERTAAAKGSVQATQDSIGELSGRATAIQSHTSMLVDGQKQLINDSAQALTYLAGIESNTAHLEQMRLDMSAMHKDMSAMRRDISDMATRGIVTR